MRAQPLLLSHPAFHAQRAFTARPVDAARPAEQSQPSRSSAAEGSDSVELSDEARQLLELTPEEQDQVQELKQRDAEVRAHEQAHVAAGGPHVRGGPTYEFQEGPDGRQYAIGGEVSIDTSPVEGDPEATIRKAQVVRAAALAPAEPSSQDRAVAAAATKMESEARQQLNRQLSSGRTGEDAPTRQAIAETYGQIHNRPKFSAYA